MRKFMKRAAAFLLVAAMLLSSAPVVVRAEATTTTDTDITAIARPATIGLIVNYGEWVESVEKTLNLPETVTVTLADGTTAEAAVTWDTSKLQYDTIGTYYLPGTVTLPDGATNGQNLKVYQVVKVREYMNLVANPGFEDVTDNAVTGWSAETGATVTSVTTPANNGERALYAVGTAGTEKFLNQKILTKLKENGPGEYYVSVSAQLPETADAEKDPSLTVYAQLAVDYMIDGTTKGHYESTSYLGSNERLDDNDNTEVDRTPITKDGYTKLERRWRLPECDSFAAAWLVIGINQLNDFTISHEIYIDDVEVVPLNVKLPYDAADDEVPPEDTTTTYQEITAIARPATIGLIVNYGDWVEDVNKTLNLPETVTVTLADGTTAEAAVTWDTSKLQYDTVGKYYLPGTVTPPDGATNGQNLKVYQVVKVREYMNLITNPGFEDVTDNAVTDWSAATGATVTSVTTPVNNGERAMHGVVPANTQRFVSQKILTKLKENGPGEYYVSVSAQLPETADTEKDPKLTCFAQLSVDYMIGTTRKGHYESTSYLGSNERLDNKDNTAADKTPITKDGYTKYERRWRLPDCDSFAAAWLEIGVALFSDTTITHEIFVDDVEVVPLNVKLPYDAADDILPVVKGATYYFSTSGNDNNDGLSPEAPMKDVTKIPALLKYGANVLLKRGDIWYLPEYNMDFSGVKGTEEEPLTLGAYGNEADPKPILAFMYQKPASEWTDEGNNVYSADVSAMTAKDVNGVERVFVDGTVYSLSTLIWGYADNDGTLTALDDPANLEAEEFCVQGNRVYIKTNGEPFENVELTPWAKYGHRLYGADVSYLTIENLDLRGGSKTWAFALFDAPTCGLLIENTDFLYVGHYCFELKSGTDLTAIHKNPTIRGCVMDGMASEKEGADYRVIPGWQSIDMRDAVDGALIEDNIMRNIGHAAVEFHTTGTDPNVGRFKNCIVQNNLIEGGNGCYARAFGIEGSTGVGGTETRVHDVIFRWNECYGMTTSSHLLGDNLAVYGNIFAYNDLRFSKWNGQPYAIDVIPWAATNGTLPLTNTVIMNNTIYNGTAGIVFDNGGATIDDILIANNLLVDYSNTRSNYKGGLSVQWKNTPGTIYALNNGFYTDSEDTTAIHYSGSEYSVAEADALVDTFANNIAGDPGFVDVVDDGIFHTEKIHDFSLSDNSIYRYAGVDLNDLSAEILDKFPILQKMDSDTTQDGIQLKDLKGNTYLAGTPSVGAISYTKSLSGKVASVTAPESKIVKTGTSFAELGLPTTVKVTLEDGATVMLPVAWNESSYAANTAGEQTVTGTLSAGAHTELDLNDKTASITIMVKDKLEITYIPVISGIAVANGTAAADMPLPATCTVILEDGSTEELELTWTAPGDFVATTAGSYVFTGTLVLKDYVANSNAFGYQVTVIVRPAVTKGNEILVNPDFIENGSYDPWVMEWESGLGTAEVTTDPALVKEGEPSAIIVTASNRWGSIGQDVTAQLKQLGDGKYLFEVWMRSLNPGEVINQSNGYIQVQYELDGATKTTGWGTDSITNIGNEYVQFRKVLDVTNTATAVDIRFHTSTGKLKEDSTTPYVISGCSLIYLGANETEANVTLDKLALTWDAIKGNNEAQDSVTSDLNLITAGENGSAISWTSSDESVISANGTVNQSETAKAVTLTATITNGSYSDTVTFTVQVSEDSVADKGYDVSISTADVDADVNDIVNVAVKVESKEFENFASSELKLTYDPDVLEFNEEASSLNGATVKAEDGVLTLEDYGAIKDFGTAYTLAFTAKAAGNAEVTLTDAAFSTQEKAEKENLLPATISQATVAVKVTLQHDVELGEYFEGPSKVDDGADYSFTAKDENLYDYTVTATVDGQPVEVIRNEDGSYTVENVTGKLVITGTRTGKTFDVTVDGTGKDDVTDAADKATYGVNYTFTMPAADGYTYQLTIQYADGSNVPYTNTNGVITILGTDIIGAFTITVTKDAITSDMATVIVDGNAAGDVTFEPSAVPGTDYTFTVTKDDKYDYSVGAKIGETALELTENDGTYTIKGDAFKAGETITITANKTLKLDNVTVTEYVTVDEAKIWLIRVNVEKLETEVYAYCEQNMFWSEKYNAYCFLVVSSGEQPVVESGDLTVVTGTATDIDYGMDVNKSEKVDANDAQLVYNMYNAHYADFTEDVTMEKFLRADVNFDATINVEDAQAVINYLLG